VGFEPTNPYGTAPALNALLTKYVSYLLTTKVLKPSTIERKVKMIKSLVKNHGVDLANPDAFVRFLNTVDWKSGTKDIAVDSYRDYLNMIGLTQVKLPHIRREATIPFIPLEEELDALIAAVTFKIGTFLRLLKETGVRPIEAWRVKWLDIDVAHRCVTVTPAKYSRPRKLKLTEPTLNLILARPRQNEYVWSPSGVNYRFHKELAHFTRNYCKQRKRIAAKLKNPRIQLISLRTFRHWKATTEYVKTKDIVHVKELLGHVNIQNTLRYIHLANAITDVTEEFVSKVATTVEEACALIEQGFEYVCDVDETRIFRKRK
jgi:integrase